MSVSSSAFEKSIVLRKLFPLKSVICFNVVVYVPSKPRPLFRMFIQNKLYLYYIVYHYTRVSLEVNT